MGVGRQRQVYDAIKETYPETWSSELIGSMEGSGARAIGEITKYLSDFDKDSELSEHLMTGLDQRSLGFEVLTWICKERKGCPLILSPIKAYLLQLLGRLSVITWMKALLRQIDYTIC